uniref:JmjC domain-containing protein n=1 Tax=Ditylum brightwellii TaxID=49249 RepID=A0A6V2C5W6_9STRA
MSEVVLTIDGVDGSAPTLDLEEHIAQVLSLHPSKVMAITDDDCASTATIIVYPELESCDADALAANINDAIKSGDAINSTLLPGAKCTVAADEESVSVASSDALEMWREMEDEARTGHLDGVLSPDGVMIQPTHVLNMTSDSISPTSLHLKRDPTLLTFDNVKRIDASQLHTISWEEPVIITNSITEELFSNRGILDKNRLASVYGQVEVRTGNRETLIDNGITNSKPMALEKALQLPQSEGEEMHLECGTIVFSPVNELPDSFQNEMRPFTNSFPDSSPSIQTKKFTLTLASEGFGIGMHKHQAAMFMLLRGRKKWYMSSSEDVEEDSQTHPGFYREKSSHKCIQKEGEVLFVPNMWYHEIFNLEYTAGIQALPE